MSSFSQILVSVVLGTVLGYAVCSKLLNKDTVVVATDIPVDSLFLVDQVAFENRQREAQHQANLRYVDSVQKAIQNREIEIRKQAEIIAANNTKLLNSQVTKPKIKVSEIKKPTTFSSNTSKAASPEKAEIHTITITPAPAESSILKSEGAAQSDAEVQAEKTGKKKKFLFFNKRNKDKQ